MGSCKRLLKSEEQAHGASRKTHTPLGKGETESTEEMLEAGCPDPGFCFFVGCLFVFDHCFCPSCPASINVLVPNCKIYNDASCDISADGQLLAVFIPSSQRGFPDEGILAIYSLAPHNLGEMLYTKRFGTVCVRACVREVAVGQECS